MTLDILNQNMQVTKARSESIRKPFIPPSQIGLDNLTLRTQSKTKVSTGSRRNNIIGYVPRLPRKEVVAPPITKPLIPILNDGQATLPSIPLIDDDVTPCFNGGLPVLDIQNGQNSKLNSNVVGSSKRSISKSSTVHQSTFNKNELPTVSSTTVPSATTYPKQNIDKTNFNNTSSSIYCKQEKTRIANGISKPKEKSKKPSSISSAKKEKLPNKQKNELPNLLDDEFGFGQNLSESSSDESDEESCKPNITYNEFGLPIITGNNGNSNRNGALNNSETFYKNNNSSSSTKVLNGTSNTSVYSSQSKSSYTSKEQSFTNLKNNYNTINVNNNMKREPVITKESNFRKEINLNKETNAAQKRHSVRSPTQDQEVSTKKKKKEDFNSTKNINANKSMNEIKKDKKEKKNKQKNDKLENKKSKIKESTNVSIKEHSSKLNKYEVNNSKGNETTKNKYSNSPYIENGDSKQTNQTSSTSRYSQNFSGEVSYNNKLQTNLDNSKKISENFGILDLAIFNKDNDNNHKNQSSMSLDFNDFGGFGGLPDLSCAINNNKNQVSTKSTFSVAEKNKNQKGVTKERYGGSKHLDIYSSTAPQLNSFKQNQTSNNCISTNSDKQKQNFQNEQQFYPQYNSYNQDNFHQAQTLQLPVQARVEDQIYEKNYSNSYNTNNVNFVQEDTYNKLNYKNENDEKIQNHYANNSNNEFFNNTLNVNKTPNEYIGLAAIKSDDHLNSRGTSESEIGILSSSDSSSSDSESSSSDSDSDEESQKKHCKTKKPYQNSNISKQDQKPQNELNNYQSSSYYTNNNDNSLNNFQYQEQENIGNAYNNHVAFLHNDLKLSESDSSDSEL